MAEDLQSVEESTFVVEQIDAIVNETLDNYLKDEDYDEAKVPHWIDAICEGCMERLTLELKKPFKYIVTCMIMQRNGAGVHTTTSCYWDTTTDDVHTLKWPSDKHKDYNKTLYCFVTVFGLGL